MEYGSHLVPLSVGFRFLILVWEMVCRNKFAKPLQKNLHLARMYVSSTYALLSVIISAMFILFLFAQMFLPWTSISQYAFYSGGWIIATHRYCGCIFFLQFITKTIGTIVTADQRPAMSNLFNVLTNILSLVAVYTLAQFSSGSLLLLRNNYQRNAGHRVCNCEHNLISDNTNFMRRHFSLIDFRAAKELMSLGVQFLFYSSLRSLFFD